MFVRTRGTQGDGMHTDDLSLVRSESSEKQNVTFESVKTFLTTSKRVSFSAGLKTRHISDGVSTCTESRCTTCNVCVLVTNHSTAEKLFYVERVRIRFIS